MSWIRDKNIWYIRTNACHVTIFSSLLINPLYIKPHCVYYFEYSGIAVSIAIYKIKSNTGGGFCNTRVNIIGCLLLSVMYWAGMRVSILPHNTPPFCPYNLSFDFRTQRVSEWLLIECLSSYQCLPVLVSSMRPGDAYMHHRQTGSPFVQLIAYLNQCWPIVHYTPMT